MLGSFLSWTLLMVFGYAYPAYECFKIVENNNHNNNNNNKPEIEQLVTWCQYWILVAMLTVLERVGDVFFSWLPLYSEAKLGFFIYLWSSKMKGTKYIYSCFFQPFMKQHEEEIDRNIWEIRSKAGNFVIIYWKKALVIGQTKFFEILQSVSSTKSAISRPNHPDHQGKTVMDSGQVDAKEACDTEFEPTLEEESVLFLEDKETKSLQHKTFDEEEATRLGHRKWRRMFASSTNPTE